MWIYEKIIVQSGKKLIVKCDKILSTQPRKTSIQPSETPNGGFLLNGCSFFTIVQSEFEMAKGPVLVGLRKIEGV
jgi:hypothetical protein